MSTAVMDAGCLGLRDGGFDAALAAFVLFLLPDPVAAAREVRRVLRPAGTLATVTWSEDRYTRAEQAWEQELVAGGAPPRPEHPSTHRVNRPSKMEELCVQAELSPQRAWMRAFEHSWDPEALLELKTSPGLSDRFQDLSESTRRRILQRTRERFAALDREAFVWRPGVVFCVADRAE